MAAPSILRGSSDIRELTIDLGKGDSALSDCTELPHREYDGTFYTSPTHPLSVAVLPADSHAYEMGCSRVARQNAGYARRYGYTYTRIDRADWEDDLYALRSSAPFRQGREMPEDYMNYKQYSSDAWPEPHCKQHLATVHGVTGADGHLAAYCQIVQCGDVARVNTILGHWEKLNHQVMWLLMLELVKWHIDECDAKFALYYTHDSGHGPGLRYFKERLGFRPATVTWVL